MRQFFSASKTLDKLTTDNFAAGLPKPNKTVQAIYEKYFM